LSKVEKAEIFANARELFFQKGYKETNVADITKKTGIAVGSFYNFYKSKDEVFLEVFLQENEKLLKRILDTINLDDDPVVVVKAFITGLFSDLSAHPILREWHSHDIYNKLEDHFKEVDEESTPFNLLNNIISNWQQEGKLRSDISSDMILAIFNTFQYIDLHKELIGLQYFPQLMDYMVDFVVEGLKKKR
jgi:AcrR family transcriptional regulator